MASSNTAVAGPVTTPGREIGKRYAKAAVYSGFGGVISRFFMGLTPVVLARLLGPTKYGIYAIVFSFVAVLSQSSSLGHNAALQKFLPEYSIKDPRRGGRILVTATVINCLVAFLVCAAIWLLANRIAVGLYRDAGLTTVFRAASFLVLGLALFNASTSVATGLQDFKTYGRGITIRSVSFLILSSAGVWVAGLNGALIGGFFAAIAGSFYVSTRSFPVARVRFPRALRLQLSGSVLREVFSFAFPAFLAGLLVLPAQWLANTWLARDTGFEAVGLFGVAFAVSQLILVLPLSMSLPAVSFMSEAYAASGQERFNSIVSTNLRLVWAGTLPICFGVALFHPFWVRFLFGGHYAKASGAVAVMSFAALFMVVNSQIGSAIAGLGKMWAGFWLNLSWLLMFLGFSWWWIPSRGEMGLAWAFFASYLLFSVLVWAYSVVILSVRYERVLRMLGLTLAAFVLTALTNQLSGLAGFFFRLIFLCALAGIEWFFVIEPRERGVVICALKNWEGLLRNEVV